MICSKKLLQAELKYETIEIEMASETKLIQVHVPKPLHQRLLQRKVDTGHSIKHQVIEWLKTLPKKGAAA